VVPPTLTFSNYILTNENIYGFHAILRINSDYLNSINQLIFVMEKRFVFFEVRTKFLNIV
jgi:hypothetical protein